MDISIPHYMTHVLAQPHTICNSFNAGTFWRFFDNKINKIGQIENCYHVLIDASDM
jgi:hypothetical protein